MDEDNSELQKTTEALYRVEREMNKLKAEMDLMREGKSPDEHALGFVPLTFMAMNYSGAISWVADTLALEMKREMLKYPRYFAMASLIGDAKTIGFKSCARFNRGEDCPKMWHTQARPKKKETGYVKELRLHCCALCAEALGIVTGHHLLSCPWLKKETWKVILEKEGTLAIDN